MRDIFICYRRSDSGGHAGRLRDALAARLPEWHIFRDLDAIGPGEDFVQAMSREIASCDVFLAVIGAHWLTATLPDGRRRLDDPDDHVRRELAEALARGVRIIPVLVAGAAMPAPGQLPPGLSALATRNAITLDDEGWDSDVERLVAAIDSGRAGSQVPFRRPAATARPGPSAEGFAWLKSAARQPRLVLVAVAVAASAAIAIALSGRSPERPVPPGEAPPGASAVRERPRSTPPLTAEAASTSTRATPVPDRVSPTAGAVSQATFPTSTDAELAGVIYEVIDAKVLPGAGGSSLALKVRVRNEAGYDIYFHGGQFRLLQGEEARAPADGLSTIVPTQTASEGIVTFNQLPETPGAAALRILQGNDRAEIPLDLTGRRGVTAAADLEARRAGRSTFQVPLDAARSTMRFGDVTVELRTGTVRRYAHKLALALGVRLHNRGRYDVAVSDAQFRVDVGGLPQAPAQRFQQIVRSEESGEASVVFDLPFGTDAVTLRTRVGDDVAEVPLRIPAAASPSHAGGSAGAH
jgi:hypothetical protein